MHACCMMWSFIVQDVTRVLMYSLHLYVLYLCGAQDGYGMAPPMSVITEESGCEDVTSNDGSDHNQAEMMDSTDNIKLQRVTGVSMRHTKALPASVVKEGWMVHYTNKSNLVRDVTFSSIYTCGVPSFHPSSPLPASFSLSFHFFYIIFLQVISSASNQFLLHIFL